MVDNISTLNDQKNELLVKLKGYLNAVFLNQNLNSSLKNDLIFQENLDKILTIYKYLESDPNLKTNKKYEEFLKAFNSYKVIDQTNQSKTDDIDSIWDEVSGFRVFVLNTYNIDLDTQNQYKDLDFVYNEDDKTSYGFETSQTHNSYESKNETVDNREKMFDNARFFEQEHVSYEQRVEIAANNVLIQKIYRNEIYIYETKPKIIPILKYTFFALLLLTVIFSIASFIIDIEFFNRLYYFNEQRNEAFSLANLHRGLPFSLVMTIIFLIFYGFRLFKGEGKKNENNYYSFKMMYPLVILIVLTISFFLTLFNGGFEFDKSSYEKIFVELVNQNNETFSKIGNANPNIIKYDESNWGTIKSLLEATFVLRIMLFAILLGMIIIFIIMVVFRPKYDGKRISDLKEAIKDDIINNRIDLNLYQSQTSNFFKDFFR